MLNSVVHRDLKENKSKKCIRLYIKSIPTPLRQKKRNIGIVPARFELRRTGKKLNQIFKVFLMKAYLATFA
jgi:hypothetical protein